MRREVNPDPVPPPKEWKIRKPWSPVHWSASFLMRSRTRSTTSLPVIKRLHTTSFLKHGLEETGEQSRNRTVPVHKRVKSEKKVGFVRFLPLFYGIIKIKVFF
jgi:hypothetical protein